MDNQTAYLDWLLELVFGQKINASGRDDTQQFAADFAGFGDWNAGETLLALHLEHVLDRVLRSENDWVSNVAVFVFLSQKRISKREPEFLFVFEIGGTCYLNGSNLLSLIFGRAVAVEDADATE